MHVIEIDRRDARPADQFSECRTEVLKPGMSLKRKRSPLRSLSSAPIRRIS
jgi:hypothetical protein